MNARLKCIICGKSINGYGQPYCEGPEAWAEGIDPEPCWDKTIPIPLEDLGMQDVEPVSRLVDEMGIPRRVIHRKLIAKPSARNVFVQLKSEKMPWWTDDA